MKSTCMFLCRPLALSRDSISIKGSSTIMRRHCVSATLFLSVHCNSRKYSSRSSAYSFGLKLNEYVMPSKVTQIPAPGHIKDYFLLTIMRDVLNWHLCLWTECRDSVAEGQPPAGVWRVAVLSQLPQSRRPSPGAVGHGPASTGRRRRYHSLTHLVHWSMTLLIHVVDYATVYSII